jgi:hypothetical protein
MHVHCTHEEDMRAPSVRAMTSESAAGLSQHTSNAIGLVQGLPRPAAASRQAITNRVKAGAHCKIFPLYHQISKKLTAGAVVTSSTLADGTDAGVECAGRIAHHPKPLYHATAATSWRV